MNEVKTPKKPLIVYYAIAILVVLLINSAARADGESGARESMSITARSSR